MTAAWLWAMADLRARWRSWVVLGLLAGATIGLATAGVAGARRTASAVPRYIAANGGLFDAAILANDPGFDATQRHAVAELPEVEEVYPFTVPFAFGTIEPKGLGGTLLPTTPASQRVMTGVVISGRKLDPTKADEVVVDENNSRRYGLHVGSVITVGQTVSDDALAQLPPVTVPDGVDLNFTTRLRVVGIAKSVSSETNWVPSSGFYDKFGARIIGFTNMFVSLRGEGSQFERFQRDVQRIVGHPVNVARESEIFGSAKITGLTDIEERGLLLFAFAVIVGGGVLVGQALVRSVTAGAADFPIWRAMGADRRMAVGALTLPTVLTTLIGGLTAVAVALALSPRFPIGVARRYDIDVGLHADWFVLALGTLGLIVSVLAIAATSAWWRVSRADIGAAAPSAAGSLAARVGLPPALLIGSRLAVESGRGHRAVPVRSALVGAIVGILGVVACFTFRAGISDALTSPQRSGISWDYMVGSSVGRLPRAPVRAIARDENVSSALDAVWARAVPIDHVPTPTFGTVSAKGDPSFVILSGRAPETSHEIAFAPSTMSDLKAKIGDRVVVGRAPGHRVRVVGSALVPATAHTDYDQSAWMTANGLRAALPPASELGENDIWELVMVRWRPGTHVDAAERRLRALVGVDGDSHFALRTPLPMAVAQLGRLRSLPLVLGVFFGLLGAATVAHALVTTVRRRRHDLAVLRSIGFTRRQSRVAIAWQATLLTAAGLAIGIPLGIVTGRLLWRWCAESFPVVYVPPLAVVVVLLIVPVAIAIANLLAAGPARAAARIRPAEALRTE